MRSEKNVGGGGVTRWILFGKWSEEKVGHSEESCAGSLSEASRGLGRPFAVSSLPTSCW